LRVEKAAAENQQLRAALAERTDFQLGRSAPLGLFSVMPTGEERARAFSSDSSGSAKHCEAPLGPFLCGLCAEELWLGLALPHSIHTTAEIDYRAPVGSVLGTTQSAVDTITGAVSSTIR
jgi:hypothetical protein